MMDQDDLNINEIATGVSKLFELQGITSIVKKEDYTTLDEFKKYLSHRLADLLDNNFNLLINTLYRIDIDEIKLKKIFSSDSRVYIPDALAGLIIERQIQKIYWRNKYKHGDI